MYAIDQLPELTKPQIAAVEGSEATIEAFRRLTTTFFGLLTFRLPPSADDLRELQRSAVQSVEGSGSASAQAGAPAMTPRPFAEQAVGLAKRDYVPLAVAIFVDLCLLLVSIGRPVNQFMGLERSMREAEDGPVYPILARFHDIHADGDAVRHFEVFRDVVFDLNGQYHVAVPLNIPKRADNYAALRREAHRLANLCYALEGKGILARPMSFLPGLVVARQLKRRGSKFVECYGAKRPARYRRGWDAVRSLWSDTAVEEKPAFKVYRFKRGAWPEMILGAVMGAARNINIEPINTPMTRHDASGATGGVERNGDREPLAPAAKHVWNGAARNGRHEEEAFGASRPRQVEPEIEPDAAALNAAHARQHEAANGYASHAGVEAAAPNIAQSPQLLADARPSGLAPPPEQGLPLLDQLRRSWASLLPSNQDRQLELETPANREAHLDPERIASWFARSSSGG